MLIPLRRVGVPRCHGYSTGCMCPSCAQRAEGIATGKLYYDAAGKLQKRQKVKQPWERAA